MANTVLQSNTARQTNAPQANFSEQPAELAHFGFAGA